MTRWISPAAVPEHGRLTKLLPMIALATILILATLAARRGWRDHQELAQLTADLRALETAQSHSAPLAPDLHAMTAPQFADAIAQSIGRTWETVPDSGSMEPMLHAGDLVLLDPEDISAVQVGDIIVFRAAGASSAPGSITRVVHRVIAPKNCVLPLEVRRSCAAVQNAPSYVLKAMPILNPIRWRFV
jgi:hypothetical protein